MELLRNFSKGLGLALVVSLASCARLEHDTEVGQARTRMEEATGLRADWRSEGLLRELHLGGPTGQTLELDEALELALTNNRALRADLDVIGQAKADLVQAGLLSNPMLSIMVRFPEGGGRSNLEFGIVKDFADLWLIPSRKRAAQSVLQQRLLSFVDAAIELVNETKSTYYTLQYQHRAMRLQKENLEILKQVIDIALTRLRSGGATQLDVNLLEARRLEVELELLQFRSDYRVGQQALLRLLGVAKAPADWDPTTLAESWSSLDFSEDDIVDWGLGHRLDVQAAVWEVEAALAEFQQQKLRLIQSLGIGIAGERTERRGIPGRRILGDTARSSVAAGAPTAPEIQPKSERRRERSRYIDFLLGPSIDVPIPIFDQNQAQISKAQFRARELHERYEELSQRSIEGITSSLAMRRLAEARARIHEQSLLPIQGSNLKVAEQAYQAGRESILTVLLAQESLLRARLGYASALRDLAMITANLERQLGGRLPRPGELPILPEAGTASQPATSQPEGAVPHGG